MRNVLTHDGTHPALPYRLIDIVSAIVILEVSDVFAPSDHTFVLAAYKKNPYVRDTIASLKSQTVPSNIILATSTPSSYLDDICSELNIEMHVNPSPRLAGDDWNFGYEAARTPLVTIAHQDDYYDPSYTERILAALNERHAEGPLIAFTDYFEMREGVRVASNALLRIKRLMLAPLRVRALSSRRWVRRRILAFGDPICCPAVTFVKPNVGRCPFDTSFINSCDYKTFVDLANRRGSFIYLPEQLVGHRIYPGSATSRNLADNIRAGEDLEILSLLWPRPIAHLVNALYSLSEKSNDL